MLVDDEILTLKMLENLIPWRMYGIEIAGSACNGESALHLMLDIAPDIVLTDIRMPDMDGLQLLRRIKEIRPGTHVVLISAYADFAYAQSAIESGCSGYLLKPVDEAELEKVVRNICEKIQSEDVDRNKMAKLEQFANLEVLQRYLAGKATAQAARKALQNLEFPLESGYRLLRLYPISALPEQSPERAPAIVRVQQMERIVERELERHGRVLSLAVDGAGAVYFFQSTDGSAAPRGELEALNDSLPEGYVLYATDVLRRLEDMSSGLRDLDALVRYDRFMGTPGAPGGVERLQRPERLNRESMQRRVATFVDSFAAGYVARLGELRAEDERTVRSANPKELPLIYNYYYNLFQGISITLAKRFPREVLIQRLAHLTVNGMERAYPTFAHINDTLDGTMDLLRPEGGEDPKQRNDLVAGIVRYLEENYQRDLSLADISSAMHISKNYLSSLFRSSMNVALWDYLTMLRLNHAKHMLEETDLPIYEISYKVGYENPGYFSRIFKQHFDTSPVEYRNRSK